MKNLIIVAVVLTAFGLAVGCTKKASSSASNSASSLNPGQVYQTPAINGVLKNMSNNATVMNISNLTAASFTGSSVLAPATLTLDLSGSSAPSGTALVSKVTSANCVVTSLGSMKYSISCVNPVLGSVSVTLTDGDGLVSSINFNVPVTCNPQTVPAIKFAPGAISVTAAGSAGYVNISVTPPTGGSVGTTFSYAIDINGDGRMDDYNQQYWSSSPSWQNVYDLYDGPRTVTVTAIDNKCQIEQNYTQVVNYQGILPAMQSGGTAVAEGYYYIQGQVAPLAGVSSTIASDSANTVTSFDAMDDGGAGAHVRCTYSYGTNGGNLTISGFNTYSDGNSNSSVESALQQNMSLGINVPNDTGGVGSVTQNPAQVNGLSYQTSMSPESVSGNQFTSNGSGCTANVTITKAPSSGTCATAPSNQVLMITMLGTYSCPNLSSAVSVTNGYFYCQYDTATNCVGGGQEGGNPPPAF